MEVQNDKGEALKHALGEYFECDPDEIGVFVIGCGRNTPDGPVFSSAYPNVAHWDLLGYVDELRNHIEKRRPQ